MGISLALLDELPDELEKLNETQAKEFYKLAAIDGEHFCKFPPFENEDPDEFLAIRIFMANVIWMFGETQGLFLKISRINHSCRPNAHWTWDEAKKKLVVRSLRDLSAGEEICVK